VQVAQVFTAVTPEYGDENGPLVAIHPEVFPYVQLVHDASAQIYKLTVFDAGSEIPEAEKVTFESPACGSGLSPIELIDGGHAVQSAPPQLTPTSSQFFIPSLQ